MEKKENKKTKQKLSKAWQASLETQGSIIILDPDFLNLE